MDIFRIRSLTVSSSRRSWPGGRPQDRTVSDRSWSRLAAPVCSPPPDHYPPQSPVGRARAPRSPPSGRRRALSRLGPGALGLGLGLAVAGAGRHAPCGWPTTSRSGGLDVDALAVGRRRSKNAPGRGDRPRTGRARQRPPLVAVSRGGNRGVEARPNACWPRLSGWPARSRQPLGRDAPAVERRRPSSSTSWPKPAEVAKGRR